MEQTGLLKINGLISWLILLTLQALLSVALLELTGLLTFNGLASWLTLPVLHTCLVALLEDRFTKI